MSDLTPSPSWDAVPQLEESTVARGGPGAPMNVQAQALANRTEFLLSTAVKFLRLKSTALAFYVPNIGAPVPTSITLTAEPSIALGGTAGFAVTAGTATLTGSGNTRTLAAADMATDSVTITATIGTYTDAVTIVKVRQGTDGVAGSAAPILTLQSTALSVTYGPTGALSPASQTIAFTAFIQNLSGTAAFAATLYNAAGASLGAVTLGGSGNTRTLTGAQFGSAQYAVVQATLSGLTDQLTVVRLADGAAGQAAVTGLLTNEAVTVAADNGGVVASFLSAGGTFKVFNGLSDVTTSSAFSVVSSSGVTVGIGAATGDYTVTAMSADAGSATLRAVFGVTTIDKLYTIAKSKAGAAGGTGPQGLPGTPGASASLLALMPTAQAFTYNSAGALNPASQTITFTAQATNLAGTAVFTATLFDAAGTILGTVVLGGSGNTRTMTAAQFGSAQYAVVDATLGGFTDRVTVVRLKDGVDGAAGGPGTPGTPGQNAVVGYLTNEAHSVATAADGTGGVYTSAGGTFKVFNGLTDVTTSAVFSVVSSSGVTGMAIGAATGVYSVTGTTTDVGTATLRAVYAGVTVDKVYTIARSKAGAAGSTGAQGPQGTAGTPGTPGTPGTSGSSARIAYAKITGTSLSATPATFTTAGNTGFPPANTWGGGETFGATAPAIAAGESLFRLDGIYDPATGNTVWTAPYLATLKVGTLSAISAVIGTLRTATTGARMEISDNVIKVYDAGGVLRVKLGDLSL